MMSQMKLEETRHLLTEKSSLISKYVFSFPSILLPRERDKISAAITRKTTILAQESSMLFPFN